MFLRVSFFLSLFMLLSCGGMDHGGNVNVKVSGNAKSELEAKVNFDHCYRTLNGTYIFHTKELMRQCVNDTLEIAKSLGKCSEKSNKT